jgi:ketosteroid isomerase-like protein
MKRLILFSALATIGTVGACPGSNATMTAMHAAAIRDSVQATLDAFRRYSSAGQWDSLAALYADDADFRWMDQGVIQYRSPAQIRQALARIAPGTRSKTTYFDTKIVALAPGVATVSTIFHTQFTQGGRPGAENGGVLDMTIVHRDDGWKILLGHSSSRSP